MSEMERLRSMLDARGASWADLSCTRKERTLYRGRGGMVSVICGPGTRCRSPGLLEAWLSGQPHEGGLLAEEVVEMFAPLGGCA